MRIPIVSLAVCLLATPSIAFPGQDPGLPSSLSRVVSAPAVGRGPLMAAAVRHAASLAAPSDHAASSSAGRQEARRSWPARHPVVLGALIGAGAGVVAAGTMENELFCSGSDEDCFFWGNSRLAVGAGIGAGVGALVGLVVGR